MCHLLQCKLLWDPHCWLSSISKTKRDRAGPGDREWDQQGDRDLTEIWQTFGSSSKCLFSVAGISFENFIEKSFSELKHPVFLLWRCGFLLPPSFCLLPTVPGAAGTPIHSGSLWWEGQTPRPVPWGSAVVSNYHRAATLGWSRAKSSHFTRDHRARWASVTPLSLQVPHLKVWVGMWALEYELLI